MDTPLERLQTLYAEWGRGDFSREVFDSETLAPVAVLPMVAPRSRAAAVPLPNGQILIVGGVDGAGAPVGKAELFTPGP